MTTYAFGADVVRTWSYCGGLFPVKAFRRGASTHAGLPTNDSDVGTVVETTTGLKTPSRWVVMTRVQMALAPFPGGQAEAQKGP